MLLAQPTTNYLRSILRIAAIGIDKYASPELTLNLAVADATGIANWARTIAHNAASPFSKVQITELYNADANRQRIREALKALETTATPADTVLIYLASNSHFDLF